ncbi:hypothetical protein [uncultured Eudoraea sp.]|uniref:hypothetical protein n=1 Tax=uncultured Eudoraea sp. TaxID=1035614 RepID=UPI002610ED19|nr:hypothetical protein [uncultured Eudoraea sp.]
MTDNQHLKPIVPQKSKIKLILGSLILIVGFLSPLLIPLVVTSNWSATTKSIISGLLAFGIPEVFMIVAVVVMGKQGYEFIKEKAIRFLKRFAPPDKVSLFRYRIGLFLFTTPILIGIIQPYLGHFSTIFKDLPIWFTMVLDVIFISSFFVLGGDFWDKLSSLFKYDVRVTKTQK